MTGGTGIGVAVALALGTVSAAAQEPLEARGAWQIVPDGENFALRTPARDVPNTTLTLHCRKEHRIFAFEIKSPALTGRPPGEDIRVGYRVDDDDQTWFSLSTRPDGAVPIPFQTPFWIIHTAFHRSGAREVAFTAGDHTWQFSLDGFAGLTESLTSRCGFEPPRSSRRG